MTTPESFVFPPRRLTARAEEIVDKWGPGSLESLHRTLSQAEIQALLERVAQTPMDELQRFADELLNQEVWALAFHLPNLPVDDRSKRCRIIIRQKWRPTFGRQLWRGLQGFPGQSDVAWLIGQALSAGERGMAKVEERHAAELAEALQQLDYLRRMAVALGRSMTPFARQAAAYDIVAESQLFRELQELTLVHGTRESFIREQLGQLIIVMRRIQRDERFVAIVDRYLAVMLFEELHEPTMKYIRQRMKMPYENGYLTERWRLVSEKSRDTFQRWWNQRQLDEFFRNDNERHAFWRTYSDHMLNVATAPGADALIMLFHGQVIVEFAQVGNAAYQYSPEFFFRRWNSMERASSASWEGHLKDRNNCVDRIIHIKGWQSTTEDKLRRFLKKER